MRIPNTGERVYAWREEIIEGYVRQVRADGTVVRVNQPFSWVDGAIRVLMDDTEQIERFSYKQLTVMTCLDTLREGEES